MAGADGGNGAIVHFDDQTNSAAEMGNSPQSVPKKRPVGSVASSGPLFDIREAANHLALLAPDEENFIFVSFGEDKSRDIPINTRYGTLKNHHEWIVDRQRDGCGIHVTVQGMTGQRRRKSDVQFIRAVYGEFDNGLPPDVPLEPSFINETSPGRFHAYWLCDPDEPITQDDFELIMACMVAQYGSDPSAKDLARVLRLPGTWNQKPGRPQHLVRTIRKTGARYGREELVEHFPFVKMLEAVPGYTRQAAAPSSPTGDVAKRLRRWFEAGFAAELAHFAAMRKDSGRNAAGHRLGATFGWAIHHGIASRSEVVANYLAACQANGVFSEDGAKRCTEAIENGIARAINDPLPLLPNRPDRAPPTAAETEAKAQPAPLTWPDVVGGEPKGRSQNNIRAFLDWRGVKLSRNAFSLRSYASIDGEFRPIDDDLLCQLRIEADAIGLAPRDKYFDDVVFELAKRNSYHPPRDYLEALTWDGTPRVDSWLTIYLGVVDTPLHRAFGRKHLLAAARRIRDPGAKHDAMLILEGAQGAGKSSAIRVLGGEWYSDALTLGDGAKEVIEQTSGAWLIELAELSGIRGKEIEQVKAMISRQSDRARLSYGRHVVDRPRQFVMFGTVNDKEYLRDTTGNRRFWPVKVGAVDLKALKRDRDQLWAEIACYERQGEKLELDPTLYGAAAAEQAARVVVDPWQEILECVLEGHAGVVATEDIFRRLGVETSRQDGNVGGRLSKIMAALGWEKTKRRQDKGRLVAGYTNSLKGEKTRWIDL